MIVLNWIFVLLNVVAAIVMGYYAVNGYPSYGVMGFFNALTALALSAVTVGCR